MSDIDGCDGFRLRDGRMLGSALDALERARRAQEALDRRNDVQLRIEAALVCRTCRGTGGGVWNDCPACDGNGVQG